MLRSVGLAIAAIVGLMACSSSSASVAPPINSSPDASSDAPPDETPDPRLDGRPYDVHVPATYDGSQPIPLVLAFHGYGTGDNGPLLETFFKFKPVADREAFLYITPNGTKDTSKQQFWNGTDACCDFDKKAPDDVGYVRAIVADVAKQYNLDKKRVYAVGLSGGGFFVHRLACDAADVFAAVLSMSGATFKDAAQCKPSEGVAVAELHGTNDDTVLFDGGHMSYGSVEADYPSVSEGLSHWATYNGCTGALAENGTRYDLFPALSGTETGVSRYANCARGDVQMWKVDNGPHAPAMGVKFASTIWSFFAAHPKP